MSIKKIPLHSELLKARIHNTQHSFQNPLFAVTWEYFLISAAAFPVNLTAGWEAYTDETISHMQMPPLHSIRYLSHT